MVSINRPKFALGQVVATPSALAVLTEAGQSPTEFVSRHVAGDWGDLCDEDRQANDDGLLHGERLLSVYTTAKGDKIWIVTESNRSVTTILLPDEY